MTQRYIMTAFGTDRPGIVADVTRVLYENGCNLDDTAMTLLEDEFTLIMLFTAAGETTEADLLRECRRLEKEKGVSAFMRRLEARPPSRPRLLPEWSLHVEGQDQAGIVFKVSQFLADNGLNIVNLQSTVKASPESGAAVYLMDIRIQVPPGADRPAIEAGLEAVADELHVDISLAE